MNRMDCIVTSEPTFGILRIQDALRDMGHEVNAKRVRRLARKMGLEAIYPKRNLSKLGQAKYVKPYLLRDYKACGPNDVWAIDITYIPMSNGFMYLTAIIDLHSRFVVAWQLRNSLEKETQTELLDEAVAKWGKPNIINSDQGSQYTSAHWTVHVEALGIQISMDGRGRATDNAFIERFFRSLKWDYVYLYPTDEVTELYAGVSEYVVKYNHRSHQGIGRQKPCQLYTPAKEGTANIRAEEPDGIPHP